MGLAATGCGVGMGLGGTGVTGLATCAAGAAGFFAATAFFFGAARFAAGRAGFDFRADAVRLAELRAAGFRDADLRAAGFRAVDRLAVLRADVFLATLRADTLAVRAVFLAPVFRAVVFRAPVLRAVALAPVFRTLARLVVLPLREVAPRPVVRFFPVVFVAMVSAPVLFDRCTRPLHRTRTCTNHATDLTLPSHMASQLFFLVYVDRKRKWQLPGNSSYLFQ
jgi:hypothetical protein